MGSIAPKTSKAGSRAVVALLLLILSPILILFILLYFLWGAILYLAIWLTHRKPFVVFVYSDSPTWKNYIEKEILPYVQDRAMILNWSERRHWKNSLAVLAVRYFGGHRNFNPMGLIFRPFHFVKTYRFFEAFKHGKVKKLEEIRSALLKELEV